MNIIDITSSSQLESLLDSCKVLLFFKVNPYCNTGRVAEFEINSAFLPTNHIIYRINPIYQKELCTLFSQKTSVTHMSPQIIITKGSKFLWSVNHGNIKGAAVLAMLEELTKAHQ